MPFKNATTVLKKFCTPLLMVKGDFGIIILLLIFWDLNTSDLNTFSHVFSLLLQ